MILNNHSSHACAFESTDVSGGELGSDPVKLLQEGLRLKETAKAALLRRNFCRGRLAKQYKVGDGM